MKNIKYVFFDLDGTITDSGDGIRRSVAYALNKLGVSEKDYGDLSRYVGPSLKFSFTTYHGLSDSESELAIKYYRELYLSGAMYENRMYNGIDTLLKRLSERGIVLAVATAKPEPLAIKVIENLGIMNYFTCISGATLDKKKNDKIDIIASALERLSIKEPTAVCMVGDRKYDIIAANELGLKSVAVLYGYGNREEFEESKAGYIVKDVQELEKVLLE